MPPFFKGTYKENYNKDRRNTDINLLKKVSDINSRLNTSVTKTKLPGISNNSILEQLIMRENRNELEDVFNGNLKKYNLYKPIEIDQYSDYFEYMNKSTFIKIIKILIDKYNSDIKTFNNDIEGLIGSLESLKISNGINRRVLRKMRTNNKLLKLKVSTIKKKIKELLEKIKIEGILDSDLLELLLILDDEIERQSSVIPSTILAPSFKRSDTNNLIFI